MGKNIVSRIDSDGQKHSIYLQTDRGSCGPATLVMAECIIKQQVLPGSEARMMAIGSKYPGSWWNGMLMRGVDGFGHLAGSTALNLYNICKEIGLPVWGARVNGENLKSGDLGPKNPAVTLVGWYGVTKNGSLGERKGGHFVVAAKFAKNGKIVFLDPWNGMLTEQSNNGNFPLTTTVGHDLSSKCYVGKIELSILMGP